MTLTSSNRSTGRCSFLVAEITIAGPSLEPQAYRNSYEILVRRTAGMGNVEEFILSQKTCTLVLLLINYLNLPQLFNIYDLIYITCKSRNNNAQLTMVLYCYFHSTVSVSVLSVSVLSVGIEKKTGT